MDQRYYASTYGRFLTADPYVAGGAKKGRVNNPRDPGSWNRYAYVEGDPVNRVDPRGTCSIAISGYSWNDGQLTLYTDCEPSLTPVNVSYLDYCGSSPWSCLSQQPTAGPVTIPCDPSGSPQRLNELNFLMQNFAAAQNVASQVDSAFNLNITAAVVLGWAGNESAWGTTGQATAGGNYFNEGTGLNWINQVACASSSKWACFGSFQDSALAAFFSSYLVNYTSAAGATYYHASAGFILADQLSQGATLAQAFQEVGTGSGPPGGFDPGDASYGTNVTNAITSATTQLNCLQQNGLIQ